MGRHRPVRAGGRRRAGVDSPQVARVRRILRDHVLAPHRQYRSSTPGRWTTVVLSALREDPDLFAEPLAPLTDLLPLPALELGDRSPWDRTRDGCSLTLHLPVRVYQELQRRAGLLGDRPSDFAAMLLGAAAGRFQPPTALSYYYEEPRWLPEEPEGQVVQLSEWGR